MVSIVESLAAKYLVQHVKGLGKCAVLKPTERQPRFCLQTAGMNFTAIWRLFSFVDVDNLMSNDLRAIESHYGIEAARQALMGEVHSVFAAYGIDVNARHLTLIADSMTYEGKMKPFSRMGVRAHPSPLLKMSFETTMAFLTDATLFGEYDNLRSPSAKLVFGVPVAHGTASFDLRFDLEKGVKE